MKKLVILIFAFIGWMLCGAIMWIGMAVTSVENTLVIHLIGAPIVFGILAFVYHKKFGHIKPLYAAIIFAGFVIIMDAGLVALFIEKSFDMFRNPIGTWIPFALIFLSTYIVGKAVTPETR
jgi:hypothetical protein